MPRPGDYRICQVWVIERADDQGHWRRIPGDYPDEDAALDELAAQQQRRHALVKEGLP